MTNEDKKLYTVALHRQQPLYRGGKKWQGTTRDVDPASFTAERWAQICAEPLLAVIEQAPAPAAQAGDDDGKGKRK